MSKKIILVHHLLSAAALNRLEYVIDFINYHPLRPADLSLTLDTKNPITSNIYYGLPNASDFYIPDTLQLFSQPVSDSLIPLACAHNNQTVYGIGKNTVDYFYRNKEFSLDIFSTIFYHITRYEEIYADESLIDSSGWMDESHHFLIKNKLAESPVVDQLLVAFFECLGDYKIHRPTQFSISHDLDMLTRFTSPYKFMGSLAATVWRGKMKEDFIKNSKHYWKMLRGAANDPYDYFDKLLRTESSWTTKTLYLMSGGNTSYDNKYQIDDPKIATIIEMAQKRGYHIGLHPSYNAGFDEQMLRKEKGKLEKIVGKKVSDNRQHWLRWSWEVTPFLLETTAFETDSSMGYKHHLGFRCGTGFGYRMYNFKEERSFGWKECPMSLMDSAALHFADGNGTKAIAALQNFIHKNQYNTAITMNFHNSNFDLLTEEGNALRAYYEHQLKTK